MSLAIEWMAAKAAETEAVTRRRAIEDELLKTVLVKDEGSATTELDGYVIKTTSRINRKIDADRLQEIATSEGLSAHLSSLFRWKPEINTAVWKATDKTITTPLAAAITAEPGRPSFSITKKED